MSYKNCKWSITFKTCELKEFPSGSVVRRFYCQGLGSIPGQGTEILQHTHQPPPKKNCESLYCIPVNCIILYSSYTSIKKKNLGKKEMG